MLVEEIAHAFRLDWTMIASAFGIAISSTVLVGLYPIWRVCNTNPAQQLKGQ
jgi:putative ABC transport system permease protein